MDTPTMQTATGHTPTGPASLDSTDPLLEWRAVTYTFHTQPLLQACSASVSAHGLLLILGVNGSGKTTLLKLAQGALQPQQGQVCWFGAAVPDSTPEQRSAVGWLGDQHRFYLELSAYENLAFSAALYQIPQQRIMDCLERVQLQQVASISVKSFSTGMIRRLAIARLLLTAPRLWLLDEPYVGLDPQGQRLLDQLLCEQQAAGAAIAIATHQFTDVVSHATALLLLQQGQAATPQPVSALSPAQCMEQLRQVC